MEKRVSFYLLFPFQRKAAFLRTSFVFPLDARPLFSPPKDGHPGTFSLERTWLFLDSLLASRLVFSEGCVESKA